MSFISPVFLLFLISVLLLFRLLPVKYRWIPLLGASWFFYAWHSLPLLSLLLLATFSSYECALRMQQFAIKKARKPYLLLGSLVLLGMLFLFKYLDLAASGIAALIRLGGADIAFDGFHLILPMGISFYVFQTLSYLIDVYRGTVPAEKHLGYYALFVSFFPQLVAGPIERPSDLLPQLKMPTNPSPQMTSEGLRLLIQGFAKKVMIADMIAPYVDAAYRDPSGAGGAALMAATALFAVQIYCDFSGYTDIARGSACLVGIRLSRNFDHPYAARTVREFWRGWHISLTRWFTDYVYIPLGGSRCGRFLQVRNILIVFLLSGLWHGADLTFMIWGLLHGLFLAAESLLDRHAAPPADHRAAASEDRQAAASTDRPIGSVYRTLRHLLTLLLVVFAWIFFRADSLSHAASILSALFTDFRPMHLLEGLGITLPELLLTVCLLFTLPILDRLPNLPAGSGTGKDVSESKPKFSAAPAEGKDVLKTRTLLLYFLLILLITVCRFLVLSQGGAPAFIYFQF